VGADTATQLSVTTLPEALLASLLGVAALIVGLHVVNGTAALLAKVTEGMLTDRTG
jgi:NAD/NADP transhydrogenase beta subunit